MFENNSETVYIYKRLSTQKQRSKGLSGKSEKLCYKLFKIPTLIIFAFFITLRARLFICAVCQLFSCKIYSLLNFSLNLFLRVCDSNDQFKILTYPVKNL